MISSLLEKVCEQNSVHVSLKEHVFFQFSSYLERESLEISAESELEALIKFSILVCSRLDEIQLIDFSQFFAAEFAAWDSLIQSFNKLLMFTVLPHKLVDEISQLVQSVQVSQTLFRKMSLVWKGLEIEGNADYINQVLQGAWLLYISMKSTLLNKTNSLGDCMFPMLGVIGFVSQRLPKYLSMKKTGLSEMFKATEGETVFWNEKISEFCTQILRVQGVENKAGSFSSIFSRKQIKNTLAAVSYFYESTVTPKLFDERTLSFTSEFPIPKTSSMPVRNINGKVLTYEIEYQNCNDTIEPISLPTTPITMVMEMIKWITDIILETYQNKKNLSFHEDTQALQAIFDKMVIDRNMTHQDSHIFLGVDEGLNVVEIGFFFNAVYSKVTKEKSNELCFKYEEAKLAKSLFVFCIELVFYSKNLIYVSFADILNAFACPAFDFFQFIPMFANVSKLPNHFKLHLSQIETKILMHLAWVENGPIHLAIHEQVTNSNSDPIENNFYKCKGVFPLHYEIFFEKMVTETGCRIDLLCKALKIEESLKEKIWSTVKYVFSDKTEMLFGKHIAVTILCSIYAVTKLEAPIKFQELIKAYWSIFEEEGMFSALKLSNGETVEIFEYYNKEYIRGMKMFIYDRIFPDKPRVPELSPNHTLVQQINGAVSQKKSPFSTPRTKVLLVSPETIATGLFCKPRVLNFENPDPPKLPKIVQMMLLQNTEGLVPMPAIKKH